MKKLLISCGIVCSLATVSHADERLFPAAILDRGETDILFDVSVDHISANAIFQGLPGSQTLDLTREYLRVRYGLGGDWQIGAALRYDSRYVVHSDFMFNIPEFERIPVRLISKRYEGRQNPTLSASYALVNDPSRAYTLIGDMQLSPNTTGQPGNSSLGFTVAASGNASVKPYLSCQATIYRSSNVADSSLVSAGFYVYADRLALVPHASYARYQATPGFQSQAQSSIGISAQLRLARGSYLIPDLNLYSNSAGDSKDGLFHRDMGRGKALALGWYQLF